MSKNIIFVLMYHRHKLLDLIIYILYLCHVLFHTIIVLENVVEHRSGLEVRGHNSLASKNIIPPTSHTSQYRISIKLLE
jgi:hypothetical protein